MIEVNVKDYAARARSLNLEHGQCTMISPDGLHVFLIIKVTDEELKRVGRDPEVEWTIGIVPDTRVPVPVFLMRFAESDELIFDMPVDVSDVQCRALVISILEYPEKYFMLISDNDHTLIKVVMPIRSPEAYEIATMKIDWDTKVFAKELFEKYFNKYPKPIDAWKKFAGMGE